MADMDNRIEHLFSKYINREISKAELEELLIWLYGIEEEDKEMLSAPMLELWKKAKEGKLPSTADKVEWAKMYERIIRSEEIEDRTEKAVIRNLELGGEKEVERKNGGIRKILEYVAAAAIIGLVILSVVFVLNRDKDDSLRQAQTDNIEEIKAPESSRAMITTEDGRTIYLDSVNSGEIAMQGGVKVVKHANGAISYQLSDGHLRQGYDGRGQQVELVYNTLFNPRGSKVIDMTLADGSQVWLNAGSSIRYPVAFIGNDRKVDIEGEAYFEIAHDASKPFIVSNGDMQVEVLGTHFNVNAYDDEGAKKVTLLEGSVRVSRLRQGFDGQRQSEVVLKPGQQANVVDEQLKLEPNANTDLAVAWVKGYFQFDKADVKTILREAARWYDLEIVYEGKVPERIFSGKLQRDLSLGSFLRLFQEANIKFRLEGKRLVVG